MYSAKTFSLRFRNVYTNIILKAIRPFFNKSKEFFTLASIAITKNSFIKKNFGACWKKKCEIHCDCMYVNVYQLI